MIISGTRLVGGSYHSSPPPTPVLSLDAGNPASYPGSGSTWTDTIGSRTFTLYNSPTYSSSNGGYLNFSPASTQWAFCSSSLPNIGTWTVEAWHYYDGTNDGTQSGAGACIVTETYPGATNQINYSLGNDFGFNPTDLQSGFFNGGGSGWQTTATGYTLTPGYWYQIVGTCDGTNNKLYVNNTLISSVAHTGTPSSSQGGIRLMRRWDNPDYWGGRLAIVNIYDNDIGTTGIANSWNANRSRFGL